MKITFLEEFVKFNAKIAFMTSLWRWVVIVVTHGMRRAVSRGFSRLTGLALKSFTQRKVYSHTIDCSTDQASLGPLVFSPAKNVYVPVALRPFSYNFVILIKTINKIM